MRLKIGIINAIFILLFTGCFFNPSDDNSSDDGSPDISVTAVSLNKISTTLMKGNTEQLFATISPSNATNKNVTWISSDIDVATVSSKGLVYAKDTGTSTIKVVTEDGGFEKECTVTVSNSAVSVTGVDLNKSSTTINMGVTEQLIATISPNDATNQFVTWSSTDSTIVQVSSAGVLTPVNAGTTTVTVKTVDGDHTDDCSVTVTANVTDVNLNKNTTSIYVGNTEQLSATIVPSNAANKNFTWSSDDDSVAEVSSSGLVSAISTGTATITVTTQQGGFTDTCVVTTSILQIDVEGVTLDKEDIMFSVGSQQKLVATIDPIDATNQNLIWTSDDLSVATVSATGIVTGIGLGDARITAKTQEGNFIDTCDVSVRGAFISTWNTNPPIGSSASNDDQVKLPLDYQGNYNFTVDWGDGSTDLITAANQVEITHTYAAEGVYDITITGECKGFGFASYGCDSYKIFDIKQWGIVKLHDKGFQFYYCRNLTGFTATDLPYLKNVTNTSYMFYQTDSFNGDVSGWDVSSVENMEYMFANAYVFNCDIDNWNVSGVKKMNYMFSGANNFNKDLNTWAVDNVEYMNSMFLGAENFNGDISNWKVGNVNDMNRMFKGAESFNGDISNWNVSSVNNMTLMFDDALNFNCDLNNWDVRNVEYMNAMFSGATSFNSDLNDWETIKAVNMSYMFSGATSFNGDISGWKVSTVENMECMFSFAESFDKDISEWNVGNVTNMQEMFSNATSFNKSLNGWNVGNVEDMSGMFSNATSFNQTLNVWNTGNVENMSGMFKEATAFNGDINGWNVINVKYMYNMFDGASSFNKNLNNWNVNNVKNMQYMFHYATSFNGDITGWNVENVSNMWNMFKGATLFTQNLEGWNPSSANDMTDMFLYSGLDGNEPSWYVD